VARSRRPRCPLDPARSPPSRREASGTGGLPGLTRRFDTVFDKGT